MNSRPVYSVDPDMRLQVVAAGRNHYQVRDMQGRVGWIEKRLVENWVVSKRVAFDTASVSGYVDNPQFIAVIDAPGQSDTSSSYTPERSFKPMLGEFVDQEKAERRAKMMEDGEKK